MDAYTRYGPALVRKARRILRNPDDAMDVVQSLFLDLLEKNQLELDLPYLYRAVTNRCISLLRNGANRARLLELQSPVLRGLERIRCDEQVIGLDLMTKLS